jgi:hypothetical protein
MNSGDPRDLYHARKAGANPLAIKTHAVSLAVAGMIKGSCLSQKDKISFTKVGGGGEMF